ncbi:MAG: hypothetical protein NT069_15020 [Planctomycetota bacterium]|nr:hypothetical protein [Planctomycetota bacterium]
MPESTSTEPRVAVAGATPPPTRPTDPAAGLLVWILVFAITCVGLAVRLLAASDELWFDELWTFGPDVVGKVRSPLDVFTKVHHENNHYLNTLVAWLLGPEDHSLAYRLPSVLCGGASVWFAARMGLRRSPCAGLFSAVAVASSYLLVHYGSEARGYSMAVCAALASWDFRERLRLVPSKWNGAVVGIAECLGVMAQPVFVCYLAAVGLMGIKDVLWSESRDRRPGIGQLVAGLPGVMWFGWLYFIDLRLAFNPGGPVIPVTEVVLQTLSLTVGGPYEGAGLWVGGVVGAVIVVGAWLSLFQSERRLCLLVALAGVLIPSAVVLVEARYEIYPRYFLVGVALAQITIAWALARAWSRGGVTRQVALVAMVGFTLAQGTHVWRLLERGRGDPIGIAREMDRESAGRILEYAGDHPYRIRAFVERGVAGLDSSSRETRFVPEKEARQNPPEWLVLHDFKIEPEFPEELRRGSIRYRRQRVARYAGLSGWSTALYHLDPR